MNDVYKIIITSSLTILSGVFLLMFERILDKFYLEPYYRFKESLIKIKITLHLYENIFTNSFYSSTINEEFRKKINLAKDFLRNDLVNLTVSHNRIVKSVPFVLLRLLCKNKIFSRKDFNKISENVILIYNSPIILFQFNTDVLKDNSLEKKEKIDEIINIIEKY